MCAYVGVILCFVMCGFLTLLYHKSNHALECYALRVQCDALQREVAWLYALISQRQVMQFLDELQQVEQQLMTLRGYARAGELCECELHELQATFNTLWKQVAQAEPEQK